MAKISNEDVGKYIVNDGVEWFQLKNDGDIARVQFLCADCSELDIFTVHNVKVGEKERYVNCIREWEDAIDVCPLCANGHQLKVVRYVLMYCLDDGKIKIWERGKQFISKLEGLANRYYPLSNTVFEIERHGKFGDKQTSYEIFPCPDVQPVDISEIEKPDLLGGVVLNKDYRELDEYLKTGNFPETNKDNQSSQQYERRAAVTNNQNQSQSTSRRMSRRG